MKHIGIGVPWNQTQTCTLASKGERLEERIMTGREWFGAVLETVIESA